MTTLANVGYTTLMDIINSYTSLDAKASFIYAAEIMARKCPFVMDMPMKASNQTFSNIDARRLYMGSPGTRKFNAGVATSAGHTEPFTDPICMSEDYSQVDRALWEIQNDPNAWRQGEDKSHIEAMTQAMETLVLYGSLATDPGGINGIMTRYNSLTKYPNGDTSWPYCVLGAGGSGSDTTSILLVEWGDQKVFGIYPVNSAAGLKIKDLGEVTALDPASSVASPKYYQALRTHFAWYMGLVVKDERCIQRVANIEISGDVNTFDPRDLIKMLNRLPGDGNIVIYANRDIKVLMDIYALDKSNGFYTQKDDGDIFGRPVTRFQGHPIRLAEKIVSTETVVA
jgi:hypothetical protein